MNPIRIRGAVGALLVSLAVIGCGGTTATTAPVATPTTPSAAASDAAPTPSAAAGGAAPSAPVASSGSGLATTGRIEVADKGFALTLPDGWTRVDLSGDDLDALIAAAGALDPAAAALYSGQIKAMLAAGLSIFAFGPDPTGGTTLTVLTLPGAGLSLDLLEQINASQLEALAEGEIVSERINLPAGEAVHFRYALAAGTGGVAPAIDQYLLVAGESQLVVTVTAGTVEDAEAIANSIEILD